MHFFFLRNMFICIFCSGLYPETHGIVGNQFYDQEVHTQTKASCKAFFNIDDQRTTEEMKWWQKVKFKYSILSCSILGEWIIKKIT